MHFTKMQGLGNDYLYVYGEPHHPQELSRRLSDRHFGAGSDGMIWISPSDKADFRMRIFNADGSEAAMCGNGIRCVGKYVYDKGYTDKTELTIETASGLRTLRLAVAHGRVCAATVDMGQVTVDKPLALTAAAQALTVTPVSVGNPHAVTFVPDAEAVPLAEWGAALEHHPAFPGGVNAEFVQVIDRTTLRMRVWERGSGITMACGTGACAASAAAVAADLCPAEETLTVRLDGGELHIRVGQDRRVWMTGPAETVYEGEVDL